MWQKIHIKQHERGLLFRRGDFVRPLGPGTYRIPFWGRRRDRIEVVDTLKTKFEHPLLDVLVEHDRPARAAPRGRSDRHAAGAGLEGRPARPRSSARAATPSGRRRRTIEVETFDVSEFRFAHPQLQAILQHPDATKWLDGVQVERQRGRPALPRRRADRALGEGLHVFWKGTGKVALEERSTCASRSPTSRARKS